MYGAGRAIQFLGLVVAGAAFFVGVIGQNSRRELAVLGLGAAIFFAGWLLQRGRR
ncbi:MAG TPA: hypothetical protein VMN82_05460 [Thermoanaerobaculia bacterium]|nr:hypothetical protein [Thermoanaerobaculia bacterium]